MPFIPDQQKTSGFVPDPIQIDPQTLTTEQLFGAQNSSSPTPPDVDATKVWKAATYGKMLDVAPGYAYQNIDLIDQLMHQRGGDDFDKGIGYAAETGWEETPLGMLIRGQSPEPFESHDALGNFVHDIVSMASDPVFLVPTIIGSLFGAPEVGAAVGFALDSGTRQGLMDHYRKGDVKSFGELTSRAGDILWAATKGGLTGEAGMLAGELPVGGLIARSLPASLAMKGLYQASAMTTMGSLLDGRVPRLDDFVRSAAVMVPLNLATGGLLLRGKPAERALMDVYSENGATPEQSTVKLEAQPHVPPDLGPGLKPAIEFNGMIFEADEGETHPDVAARIVDQAPVSMERLEADPKLLADKILQIPEIHLQEVIDRAWGLKKDALASGEGEQGQTIDSLYDRSAMKSGRGFTTPDGKFLSRTQARAWVRENEPANYAMWESIAGAKAEFHSDDYGQARERVANRALAEGEPDLDTTSQQLLGFLARSRTELNQIKSGAESSGYGNSVLRTLFVGPRNMLRAEAEQLVSGLRRIVPNYQDQEALSFLRDYRDAPDELRAAIDEIRSGGNEKLKAFIPSMERALNPSPEMLKADQQITSYFAGKLDQGRQLGILDSSIDPARYSPRLFMKVTEDAEETRAVGRPKFTERTANAIRREHLRLLDPLKSGDFEARTFNAFDELSVYADRYSTAAATKLFTTELKNSELGKWGSRGTVPQGWVELAPSERGFHQTMTVKDAETGESHTFSRGLYVPKVVADAMKPMLESGGIPTALAKVLHAQSYVKAVELSLSPFHMKALSITAVNNMSLGDFVKALNSDNASPEFESSEREGALYGLETTKTGTPYEAYRGLKPSSLPTGLDKIRNLPVIEQVDAFARSMTHGTFDVIQRKFKVMDFSLKQAAWIAKNAEASDAEYGSAMRGIAKEVNAAYGGLNWDVLGVSRGMRDLSRLFILAPDWTFSNIANLKYTFEGGPAGSAARTFWVKSFATGILLSQAASILIGGKTHEHNITDVYLGKDQDGKEMYSNWFFAGAPKDAITLVNRVWKDGALEGLAGFMANKLSPVAGTFARLYRNQDWAGRSISKPADGPIEKTGKQGLFAVRELTPVPFGLKDIVGMMTDPDKEHSYWDYVLALGAMTVTHEGDQTRTRAKEQFRLPGVQRRSGFRLPGERRRRQ